MKKRVIDFRPAVAPIETATDKLGGQPVWRSEPCWPLGSNGEPLMFVCQIQLKWVIPNAADRVAYVFFNDDPACAGYAAADGGDTAVIVQPGGRWAGPMARRASGPTVCRRRWVRGVEERTPVEFHIDTTEIEEAPEGMWEHVDPKNIEAFNEYFAALTENKIGGRPVPTVNRMDLRPWPVPDDWRLIVQLDASVDDGPYFLNFALDGVAYAMISPDGFEGRFWFDR